MFGEALRSGTAVAALTWRPGTCADAALCQETGVVALVDSEDDDESAATRLAEAITTAEHLNASRVQEIGLSRFDPTAHFRVLADGRADG